MSGETSVTGIAPANIEVIIAAGEVGLFKSFLRNKRAFEVLLGAGVFELADGKATINVNHGIIQSVSVEERRYTHVAPPKGFG